MWRSVHRALGVAFAVSVATSAFAESPPSAAPVDVARPPREPLPSLARVVDMARERAPEVVVGRADVEVARSSFAGARLAPFTNPSFGLLFDRGTQKATKDVTISGSLVVPVEVAGQRATRVAEVEALVDWQVAGLESSKASAAAEATRAYGAVVVAAERARTFQAIVSVARNEAEVYQARLASGDATEQDTTLARVELAKNSVILAESRADLTRALFDLERVVGVRFTVVPEGQAEPPLPRLASQKPVSSAPLVRASEKEAEYHARAKERVSREAFAPLELIFTAGRGDLGEARFGGGVGWSFPIARRNQGEQARSDAARIRANVEKDARARFIATSLDGVVAERREVRSALAELTEQAVPAARAAVDAAVETQRAGKGELLRVLTARRDLATLELRRLELLAREWTLVSDAVALTGELP